MSNHSSPSFTAGASLSTKKQKLSERIPRWAWFALVGVGLILAVLGLAQEFTTVTCGNTGFPGIIKSYPVVPMCTSFVGYDYLVDIVGICILLVSGSKLLRVALNGK